MNLHGIVAGAVGAVNPPTTMQIKQSGGYTTAPDGSQQPSYGPPTDVQGQVQPLQYDDVRQLDGLNIQGERRAVYLYGDLEGVVRADQRGGDLLLFPERPGGPVRTWLVVFAFETWPDWCKVAVTLQND